MTATNHALHFAQGKPDDLNPEDRFILELIERTEAWGHGKERRLRQK
jgi:hypothetical protein